MMRYGIDYIKVHIVVIYFSHFIGYRYYLQPLLTKKITACQVYMIKSQMPVLAIGRCNVEPYETYAFLKQLAGKLNSSRRFVLPSKNLKHQKNNYMDQPKMKIEICKIRTITI